LEVADPGFGVEVIHWADMPGRCGVGSSSSFVVGLLNALYSLRGEFYSPHALWKRACYVEQEVLGEVVGLQDQAWAAFGGIGRIDFPAGNDRKLQFTPLPLPQEKIEELCSHLTVVYTGTQRTASEAAKEYASDSNLDNKIHAIKALAEEGWDAMAKGDWERLGSILDRAWFTKRSLTPGMTSSPIDQLCSTARIYGTWGCKLMGAGGGAGCVVLMTPPESREAVLAAVKAEFPASVAVPVKVSRSGSRVIHAQ
jgi:D-glycero-alpha-D-manno-heptose-7-phosphate kinase